MSIRAVTRRAAAVTTVTTLALSTAFVTAAQADEVETANAVVSNAEVYPGADEPGERVYLDNYDYGDSLTTKLIGLRTEDGAELQT